MSIEYCFSIQSIDKPLIYGMTHLILESFLVMKEVNTCTNLSDLRTLSSLLDGWLPGLLLFFFRRKVRRFFISFALWDRNILGVTLEWLTIQLSIQLCVVVLCVKTKTNRKVKRLLSRILGQQLGFTVIQSQDSSHHLLHCGGIKPRTAFLRKIKGLINAYSTTNELQEH